MRRLMSLLAIPVFALFMAAQAFALEPSGSVTAPGGRFAPGGPGSATSGGSFPYYGEEPQTGMTDRGTPGYQGSPYGRETPGRSGASDLMGPGYYGTPSYGNPGTSSGMGESGAFGSSSGPGSYGR